MDTIKLSIKTEDQEELELTVEGASQKEGVDAVELARMLLDVAGMPMAVVEAWYL
jgi:hypothetical protein